MAEHEHESRAAPAAALGIDDSPQQSTDYFRLLMEGVVDYAIFGLDPDGYVTSWNTGARRIKGYSDEEIIGKHFSRFYPPEALARGWPDHELAVARVQGRFEDEGWRVRKDGTLFWANVIITTLYDPQGRVRGFVKVTRDLTQRKRIESLEESRRQMDEFLAMLAHELRNPLAPIGNALGIMQAKELQDPALRWARDVIARQVEQLVQLTNDLLDVSRITTGRITLRKEPLALATVVARAVESSQPLIDARKQRLEVVLPDDVLKVEGDLTRLSQVLLNLLNNSAKYTPEGGQIYLSIEKRKGHEVAIRVRDTGVGIPSDLLPKVFDLFTQGDSTPGRSEGGLGLGLSLVKQLVSMHGGSVSAFSDGPGKGSEFVVRLPLLDAQGSDTEADTSKDEDLARQRDARRILVVDDNVDTANSMAMLLHLWGHEARSAYDGPTALKLAAEYRPEVVLLDIGLPGMDGYEVARRLQDIPELREMTLIAMTGYGQDEDRRRTREAGFYHHLIKPIDPDTLQAVLATTARSSPMDN